MSHVIAAVSTGLSVSAIGILRLSGDGCAEVAGKVFTLNNKKPLSEIPDRKLMLGDLRDKEGRAIDSCCVIVSFKMSHPARTANTDSRLMMREAVVGSISFCPTICME